MHLNLICVTKQSHALNQAVEFITWWRWDLPHDWVPIVQANLYQSTQYGHKDY